MKTKALRRKLRQITDIVEDVDEWMLDNIDTLSTKASYEVGSLESKMREIRTLAEQSEGALQTIEMRTEHDP